MTKNITLSFWQTNDHYVPTALFDGYLIENGKITGCKLIYNKKSKNTYESFSNMVFKLNNMYLRDGDLLDFLAFKKERKKISFLIIGYNSIHLKIFLPTIRKIKIYQGIKFTKIYISGYIEKVDKDIITNLEDIYF